jgi:arginine utilization protein RocB
MDDVQTVKSEVITASNELRDLYREKRGHEKTLQGLGNARKTADEELRAWVSAEAAPQNRDQSEDKLYELAGLFQKAREQTHCEAEIARINKRIESLIVALFTPRFEWH